MKMKYLNLACNSGFGRYTSLCFFVTLFLTRCMLTNATSTESTLVLQNSSKATTIVNQTELSKTPTTTHETLPSKTSTTTNGPSVTSTMLVKSTSTAARNLSATTVLNGNSFNNSTSERYTGSSILNTTVSTTSMNSTTKTTDSVKEATTMQTSTDPRNTYQNTTLATDQAKRKNGTVTSSLRQTTNTKLTKATSKPIISTNINEKEDDHTTASTDESRDNITDTGRLQYVYDDFDAGDKLWPVGMALTIGIPTIIVLAVTITVLYKRQVAKPRSNLSFYGQSYTKM